VRVLISEYANFTVYHISLGNLVNPMKEKAMLQFNVLKTIIETKNLCESCCCCDTRL